MRAIALNLPEDDNFHLLDSKPVPVCHPIPRRRVRRLHEDGDYFGKTSKGWFFGFKLRLLTAERGHILGAVLTLVNWDDHDPALALRLATEGDTALADIDYTGAELAATLDGAAGDLLFTVTNDGPRHSARRSLISSVRERVETSLSQLWGRFIDRVYNWSWSEL